MPLHHLTKTTHMQPTTDPPQPIQLTPTTNTKKQVSEYQQYQDATAEEEGEYDEEEEEMA